MGKLQPSIDEPLRQFIAAQSIFFVATAPLDRNGHVNISPKGLDTFRILDPTTVAYLDLTGSGVETIAHLKENRRIVVMFCAFAGAPRIVRLHGHGTAVEPHQPEFTALQEQFPAYAGTRAIIRIDVTRISTSCGTAVPLLSHEADRDQLTTWARNKGTEGLASYREEKNRRSIDNLPGVAE